MSHSKSCCWRSSATLVASWLLAAAWLPGANVSAQWSGWMGDSRDNRPSNVQLPEDFQSTKPKLVWEADAAGGYSGPAVVGESLFLTDYQTNDDNTVTNFERKNVTGVERVRCLDAATGTEKWSFSYPVSYTISYPAGPRVTPTVEEDRVYTLGAEGDLYCFDVQSGDIRWNKKLPQEYKTKAALWGYASHPLIDGDKLVCVVGGDGTHTVAFNKSTGEEIWRYGSASEQGYVPPTLIQTGGTRQLITASKDWVSSLNPDTGDEYWSVPYEATNGSIIMSPVTTTIEGKHYLYLAGYSNKNLLLELAMDQPTVKVVWQDLHRQAIAPVNVQPMVEGNMLYGFDQKGTFIGAELPSGERLWETALPLAERPVQTGTAFLISPQGDDRYALFTEQGDLVLADLSPKGFREIDRTHLIEPAGVAFGRKVVWSAPAYVGSRIYVRNDKQVLCYDLGS
ncbi:PQQ-binding-like beta-propeller repeat protein [Rhodopirellula halodulae]|uniref:PQQ-binding-like beta-propeller repeat protein n=1 Tax=Rhodopirellula halodulae TaxID=2894198 RepID=UPI001E41E98B|nr:PQQ-binding-like beta-propeller repeat protein [Rhodopirellula sp. JC737]MCC9654680.1 PQQ-like beta-propeller repeat protein [Rhodopirellula sp. JC737]